MKRGSLVRFLACGALLTLAVTVSSAEMFRANIPFDFAAASSTMLAGEYTAQTSGSTDQMLQMCSVKSVQCVFLAASQVATRADNTQVKLVFHRYGDQYFLSEIWSPYLVRTLPESRSERELAKAGSEPVVAVIAAELTSRAGR
jgi:hypothetical protein